MLNSTECVSFFSFFVKTGSLLSSTDNSSGRLSQLRQVHLGRDTRHQQHSQVLVPANYQVSISSTFYEQLLRTQIPKVQKRHSHHQDLFALLVSGHVNAAHKTLMKLTPGLHFNNLNLSIYDATGLVGSGSRGLATISRPVIPKV